jgi:hypothetical protein
MQECKNVGIGKIQKYDRNAYAKQWIKKHRIFVGFMVWIGHRKKRMEFLDEMWI